MTLASAAEPPAEARVSSYDWEALSRDLNNYGCGVLES